MNKAILYEMIKSHSENAGVTAIDFKKRNLESVIHLHSQNVSLL